MYIRRVKKQRSPQSKVFYQYTLAQTVRQGSKVKQRNILYLGSDTELDDPQNRTLVLAALKARIQGRTELFPADMPAGIDKLVEKYISKYYLKYGDNKSGQGLTAPPDSRKANYHQVDIDELEVSQVRSFGAEHLCMQILDKLRLADCLLSEGMKKDRVTLALISIVARAVFRASEHKTAQILADNSELSTLYGYNTAISHKQLYCITDELFEHREAIDRHLYNRVTDMFDLEDKLVIFDISNSYFETRKEGSQLAKHGKSKEKRNDCPLVVFTGVINAEGFLRHSRIYQGNKADSATLEDMLADLEAHSKKDTRKTIVLDAGIATEDNLSAITEKGYHYVCVARRQLKNYHIEEGQAVHQLSDRNKNTIELAVLNPPEYPDTWMYVKSENKRKKETSMDDKLSLRYEEELENIRAAFSKKGGTKKTEKVWERIGRAKERNKRVSAQYQLELSDENGTATHLEWQKKQPKPKTDKKQGIYFIRTNYTDPTATELWQAYNTIREVEATFRCLKTDLQIRPLHHQKDSRIQSHIYLALIAYQLVNTIRHMLKQKNITHDWTNILRILSTHTIQTVELNTETKNIHIRKPAKPEPQVKEIYQATNTKAALKTNPKYVVYH